MKKKILLILFCTLCLLGVTGCTNQETVMKEMDTLKRQIAELQKEKEEANKETIDDNSNNDDSDKEETNTSTLNTTTTDNSKEVEDLKQKIITLNKKIAELENKNNKQTSNIERLQTELNNKYAELEKLQNNTNTDNSVTMQDLVGTWNFSGDYDKGEGITFNSDGTAISHYEMERSTEVCGSSNPCREWLEVRDEKYTYTVGGNILKLTLNSSTVQKTNIIETVYGDHGEETKQLEDEAPVTSEVEDTSFYVIFIRPEGIVIQGMHDPMVRID